MLYTYAMKLGGELLARGQVKAGLKHLIQPVAYWRFMEYRLVCESGEFQPEDRILDIGSPKTLSIYLAKTLGADVYATDIDGYFIEEYATLRDVERLPPEKFHVSVEDGRNLSFPDSFFSKVYSISVLEHIPDTGDSECVEQIGRVLAPGGRCMITVPFGPKSQNVYKRRDAFYWADSSKKAEDGSVFFQRRYSENDLFERLINPSGLKLRSLRFVGERVLTDARKELFEIIPAPVGIALGPVHPLISQVAHTQPVASWHDIKKPLCALVVLEKA